MAESGCTPGYWKQQQHFDSWPAPYTPTTKFSTAFSRTITIVGPGNGKKSNTIVDPTLLEALQEGGGDLNALARQAVAALLNAADSQVNPDPAFNTTAKVIAAFQAAYDSGNYGPTEAAFDTSNNLGCPLS